MIGQIRKKFGSVIEKKLISETINSKGCGLGCFGINCSLRLSVSLLIRQYELYHNTNPGHPIR